MDTISDIQRTLENEFSVLVQNGSDLKTFITVGMKAINRLATQSEAGEPIKTFLIAATLLGSYNAYIALNQGEPEEASQLIVRCWQECVRHSKECPIPTLDPEALLAYHEAISDYLDAEVRFGKRY
jgi:hypothetical protein